MLVDITFDIANIIDSKLGTIYTMNKFATNIYENIIKGISKEEIVTFIESKIGQNHGISSQIELFEKTLKDLELLNSSFSESKLTLNLDFAKEDKYKISILKFDKEETLELIKMEEKENELCIK